MGGSPARGKNCTVGGGCEIHTPLARIEAWMIERVRSARRFVGGNVSPRCFIVGATMLSVPAGAAELTPEQVEFFETKVRPVLAGNCYSCHGAEAAAPFANLRLDSRAGMLKGGDSGTRRGTGRFRGQPTGADDPFTPRPSRCLPPASSPKTKSRALVKWVEMEAPWPNEATAGPAAATKKFDLEARRREHWAWQPIRSPAPPAVKGARHPVDRFPARQAAEEIDFVPRPRPIG